MRLPKIPAPLIASVAVILLLIGFFVMFKLGERQAHRVHWLSELMEKGAVRAVPTAPGSKPYLIDWEVYCANGKDIGRLQVDLDLTNGKLRIVRNDSKLAPDCSR